jgi:hypothetical protein
MRGASIPELATFLSFMLDEGVQTPDDWYATHVCFTSMLTSTERRRNVKGIQWRPSKL